MTSTRSDETVARWQATAELQPLVKNWWMMAGRGVLVVLFGAATALWRMPVVLVLPHAGSDRVVPALAAYAFVFGIVILLASLRFRLSAPTWQLQRVRF